MRACPWLHVIRLPRAVDREVILAHQPAVDRLRDHAIEEPAVEIVVFEPLAIHAECLLRPSVVLHRQVQKAAIERVLLNSIDQLRLSGNRVQRLQQQALEQLIRRDGRPAPAAVGPVEMSNLPSREGVELLSSRP